MRYGLAGFAILVVLAGLARPGEARAQAVGFQPGVGVVPDGVGLGVTPVVSADRRYVRLSLGVGFQTVDGFTNFPVPAAVSGGGGGGGGIGGGGIGVVTGMNGPIGPASGMGPVGYGFSDYGMADGPFEAVPAWRPSPRRARTTRPKSVRPRVAAPDPAIARAKAKP